MTEEYRMTPPDADPKREVAAYRGLLQVIASGTVSDAEKIMLAEQAGIPVSEFLRGHVMGEQRVLSRLGVNIDYAVSVAGSQCSGLNPVEARARYIEKYGEPSDETRMRVRSSL